jgi:hypothetical protein
MNSACQNNQLLSKNDFVSEIKIDHKQKKQPLLVA